MNTVKIYTLSHPDTGEIRYVGKTIQSIEKRLVCHISDARAKRYKTHNLNWIVGLLRQDKLPIIQLLDTLSDTENYEWLEQYWIAQCKAWGLRLTNLTAGGDGNKNQVFSRESQLRKSFTMKENVRLGVTDYANRAVKISKALTGRKLSEATKHKVRLANLGKHASMASKLKKATAIVQYNLDGTFVSEWKILCEASRSLGISKGAISNVCKGRQKTAGGFLWKYKNEDIV